MNMLSITINSSTIIVVIVILVLMAIIGYYADQTKYSQEYKKKQEEKRKKKVELANARLNDLVGEKKDIKSEEPKAEEPKAEEPKAEETKVETTNVADIKEEAVAAPQEIESTNVDVVTENASSETVNDVPQELFAPLDNSTTNQELVFDETPAQPKQDELVFDDAKVEPKQDELVFDEAPAEPRHDELVFDNQPVENSDEKLTFDISTTDSSEKLAFDDNQNNETVVQNTTPEINNEIIEQPSIELSNMNVVDNTEEQTSLDLNNEKEEVEEEKAVEALLNNLTTNEENIENIENINNILVENKHEDVEAIDELSISSDLSSDKNSVESQDSLNNSASEYFEMDKDLERKLKADILESIKTIEEETPIVDNSSIDNLIQSSDVPKVPENSLDDDLGIGDLPILKIDKSKDEDKLSVDDIFNI